MLDWTQTMSQSYRFYKVDPVTWMDGQELNQISDCSINWDSTSSTLGSASITTSEIYGSNSKWSKRNDSNWYVFVSNAIQ